MKNLVNPVILGIDGNEANSEKRVGTGEYAYQLLLYWSQVPDLSAKIYLRDVPRHDLPTPPLWDYEIVTPRPFWLNFGLPLHLLLKRASHGCYFGPAHYLPFYTAGTSVVTVHDLAYEYFPEMFLPRDLYKLRHWTKRAVRVAKTVIAVSESTKRDLVHLYHVPARKIKVVYNGYDTGLFREDATIKSDILKNLGLAKTPYILYLGTIQPRKNILKLVEAYTLLQKKGYQGKLVIAGNAGWMSEETLKGINANCDVILTGYISTEDQVPLYQHADIYALPSLYEGFGVPILEAMACGTPVVASNNSSLPEVVGEGGVLFDPHDANDIVEAITKVLNKRSYYAKKALLQAKKFSWEKCAQETLDILLDMPV